MVHVHVQVHCGYELMMQNEEKHMIHQRISDILDIILGIELAASISSSDKSCLEFQFKITLLTPIRLLISEVSISSFEFLGVFSSMS